MQLSIIILVKRGIVFQLDKIMNALRQKKKMSFSLCTAQCSIPCVLVTKSVPALGAAAPAPASLGNRD